MILIIRAFYAPLVSILNVLILLLGREVAVFLIVVVCCLLLGLLVHLLRGGGFFAIVNYLATRGFVSSA
jgi:hypothetical protein